MDWPAVLRLVLLTLLISLPAGAQQPAAIGKPNLLLQQIVEGMPQGDRQEVRVLTATLNPGDATPFHTHRSPVTIYVLAGVFTLEMEGREPVTVRAGEAFVEPPNVRMTGYNRAAGEPMHVVIFYVSDPGTPFLDPLAKR
jgi:quercetin dioxygenase-like cupin family protein